MAIYHVPVMVEFGTILTVDATNPESAKNQAHSEAAGLILGCATTVRIRCEDPELAEG